MTPALAVALFIAIPLVVGVVAILVAEHRRDVAAGGPSIRAWAKTREALR